MKRAYSCLLLVLAGACRTAAPDAQAGSAGTYRVEFEGNDSFSDGKLTEAIALNLAEFQKSGFERSYIDDAAFDLELHYYGRGFPDAAVLYEVEPAQDEAAIVARFFVDEGPRTIVAAIRFEGNQLYPADELRAFLDGRRQGLFSTGDLYYQQSVASAAQGEIAAAYEGRGYLDARATLRPPSFSVDRTEVELVYTIEEGPAYRLGSVEVLGEVDGAGLDDDQDWHELLAELRAAGDVPYDPRAPFRMKSRLLEALGAAGYPDSAVAVERERSTADEARVDVELRVTRGPRVTLGEVRFEGRGEVHEEFVLDLLDVEPGQPVDTVAIREGIARLYGTGLFKRVGHELVAASEDEPGLRDLVVSVEEDVPIELFIEPGWGSYEGPRLKIGLRDRNLFGRGLDLTSEGKVSNRDVRGRIKLTDPRFLGTDLEAGVSVTAGEREEPTFTSRELGAGVFLTKRLTARSSITTGYQLRSTDASDVSQVQATGNEVDISSVRLEYRYDSRRSVLQTSAGFYGSAGVEFADEALHSDLNFVRTQAQLAYFADLAEDTALGLRIRGGAIQPHSGDVIPVQEQYFNGGHNTVRSFPQSKLARDDLGQIIGGEAATVFTAELRQRLVGDLEGALFYDIGNVSLHAGKPFDNEFVGQAYGVGIRYVLPIGALRLDLGFDPAISFGDELVFHFAVGNPF